MIYKCPIDNAEFATEKELHNHVARKLKIKLFEFYQTHYPRRSLQTNELIKFKNKDFYFSSLFNSRQEMLDYIAANPKEAKLVVEKLFALRKDIKGLSHQIGQAEARTCVMPGPVLMSSIGFDYVALCKKLGLSIRYDYSKVVTHSESDIKIIIDSREQNPLNLKNYLISKLDFGDYCPTEDNYSGVYVERKSLNDFVSTLSGGYERFCAEIARAKQMESYLVILIEAPLKTALGFNSLPEFRRVKATADFIFHRMREIMANNDNCQFLFVKNRGDAVIWLKNIFLAKKDARLIDWQAVYDQKPRFPV